MHQLVEPVRLEAIAQKLFLNAFLKNQVFVNIAHDVDFRLRRASAEVISEYCLARIAVFPASGNQCHRCSHYLLLIYDLNFKWLEYSMALLIYDSHMA
jgi:hypothetical protein